MTVVRGVIVGHTFPFEVVGKQLIREEVQYQVRECANTFPYHFKNLLAIFPRLIDDNPASIKAPDKHMFAIRSSKVPSPVEVRSISGRQEYTFEQNIAFSLTPLISE